LLNCVLCWILFVLKDHAVKTEAVRPTLNKRKNITCEQKIL